MNKSNKKLNIDLIDFSVICIEICEELPAARKELKKRINLLKLEVI